MSGGVIDRETEAALVVANIAAKLVLLWDHQKIQGASRAERNAAVDEIRSKLINAVHEWHDVATQRINSTRT